MLDIDQRIKSVLSAVFGIDEKEIDEDSANDNIEAWDSLNHMTMVVALEEEFELEFDEDDIENLLNFRLIRIIVKEKLDYK